MRTICIYHADCMDGTSAAAVVKYRHPEAELVATNHGEPPPEKLAGARVYIVDFSFPKEILEKIKSEAAEVHWYDHHKTAIPAQQALGWGIVDLNESGATLTWKQLFPNEPLPKILGYIRDKDLWLWELPDSRAISLAIAETQSIMNPKHVVWSNFFKGLSDAEWNKMVEWGNHSRRLLRQRIEKAGRKGFEIILDGHKTLAVNWTSDSSDLGEYIYKDLKIPVALIFSYSGKEWTYSMRSNTVDVSEIAVKRGGGGHPGAAGFRTQSIDWLFELRK